MNKEYYSQNVTETSVSVVGSQVDAVRTKDITRKSIRLYDGEHIGIAGGLGSPDMTGLESRAEAALGLGIAYPFFPAEGTSRKVVADSAVPAPGGFVAEVETLLSGLRSSFPDFLFSNKVNLTRTTTTLQNDRGLDYSYSADVVDVSLLAKPKSSVRVFDTFVGFEGTRYSRDALLSMAQASLPPYLNEVPVEPGEYPVCFFADDITYQAKLLRELHGLIMGSGGSLFSGKLGEKLFNERFTVLQSRSDADNVFQPFFDVEGTTNANDRVPLIDKGAIKGAYTNRRFAKQFDLPLTGAAGGEYDGVPDLGQPSLVVQESGKSIAELLGGRKAILVYIAAGGDFTPDGAYASPVQSAYVLEDGRIVGKAPEFAITSHLYKMFGDDFGGVSRDDFYEGIPTRLFVTTMQVSGA